MNNKPIMGFENLNGNIFGDKQIKITRHVGDLNKATLEDGVVVYRQQKVRVNADMPSVKCAPYDNQFLFNHVFKGRGWTIWCSCGSPGCAISPENYKKDNSNIGTLVVCMYHAGIATGVPGRHADGSS